MNKIECGKLYDTSYPAVEKVASEPHGLKLGTGKRVAG